ncbi:MAG TPA: phosphoenolpyruvate--protein phosphotransferase [Desulfobacteraceae bacterium]|nr:phosphoenolpyruvate--protein phosphotransferase [Desulfobacteraceae bacterium]
MSPSMFEEKFLYGINASPGICIGRAYLVNHVNMDIVEKYYLSSKDLPAEIKRFKAAVKKTKDELDQLIKKTPDAMQRQTDIFKSHLMMLKDKMLYDKVIETCNDEQVNAEWAVKNVAANLKMIFHQMENPYLSARVADLTHVTDSVMRNLVGAKKVDINNIKKRVILVADDLSPAQTSQISLKKTQGFVTNRGGKTSHTSIIARTLGIPAVLGLDRATDLINDEDLIIVDGTAGIVIIHPEEKTLLDFSLRQEAYDNYKATLTLNSDICAKTTDNVRLNVMGNIELPEEADSVISHGGDGIGLYRTEFQYLNCPMFPSEDDLFEKYKSVVELMAPKPVTIRTLDINGDKAIGSMSGPDETNPFLGLRAIRYCLKNPDIFQTQLKAILRAAAFGNVRILFPMISCYDEIIMARALLNKAASILDAEGTRFNLDIDIGIMLEIPSAIIMADKLSEQVDFFSFGTNDLIQYSLAIDRGNRDVAYLYDGLQPAVIRLMKHAADVAEEKGKRMSLCGEMAADSLYTPIILGLGIDELSMNPRSIPAVKNIIRSISMKESRQFLAEVLKQSTASDIMEMLQDTYGSLLSEKIY